MLMSDAERSYGFGPDVMARARLANGGRCATAEQTEPGPFGKAVAESRMVKEPGCDMGEEECSCERPVALP